MTTSNIQTEYGWTDASHTAAHDYTLPAVFRIVEQVSAGAGRPLRILDLGCGNGATASKLAGLGHTVVAVDASPDGVAIASSAYPNVRFKVCSVYDEGLGGVLEGEPADCVISLDVVEHLFFPGRLFEQSYALLRAGGSLIVSTPYHGYMKNLALSLANGWDRHFDVDKDGGHIKFFSKATLGRMARAAGFENLRFSGVGRLPGLWKAMIMVAEKR
jgi:2-polyprenyl-3-methyl-5-hydroxy-6-metoxy-1,4-benzoquinol methylase